MEGLEDELQIGEGRDLAGVNFFANKAFNDVRNQGALKDFPIELRMGDKTGPGHLETIQPGDTGPNGEYDDGSIDSYKIELRKAIGLANSKGLPKLRNMIRADSTHILTSKDRAGKPVDPKMFGIKRKIIDSLDNRQMSEALQRYERTVQMLSEEGSPPGSNWESFPAALDGPLGDWLVFERVFPELMNEPGEQKWMAKGGGFNKKQLALISEARKHIGK